MEAQQVLNPWQNTLPLGPGKAVAEGSCKQPFLVITLFWLLRYL